MHSHVWTTRALLHERKQAYRDIAEELRALQLQIAQIEDLEAARDCQHALERLWQIFKTVVDVER